mmetsp:Transcript_5743/g.17588  ORF Transcript_5743/g.17588 Transcript_5743/m.17588 type:complete len:290 (+) Transcript_5743:38-907(+)
MSSQKGVARTSARNFIGLLSTTQTRRKATSTVTCNSDVVTCPGALLAATPCSNLSKRLASSNARYCGQSSQMGGNSARQARATCGVAMSRLASAGEGLASSAAAAPARSRSHERRAPASQRQAGSPAPPGACSKRPKEAASMQRCGPVATTRPARLRGARGTQRPAPRRAAARSAVQRPPGAMLSQSSTPKRPASSSLSRICRMSTAWSTRRAVSADTPSAFNSDLKRVRSAWKSSPKPLDESKAKTRGSALLGGGKDRTKANKQLATSAAASSSSTFGKRSFKAEKSL